MRTKKHLGIIDTTAQNLKLIFSENNFEMSFEVRHVFTAAEQHACFWFEKINKVSICVNVKYFLKHISLPVFVQKLNSTGKQYFKTVLYF